MIRVLPGAQSAEAALFAELDEALGARVECTPPLRVVVPSRSLRDHLSRALLRYRGSAILGVSIQSHYALALEALERVGQAPFPGQSLSELLARRAILGSPRLERELARFEGGADRARASIRDLLDAGFGPDHLATALECLTATQEGRREERVADLLHAAVAVVSGLEQEGAADASLLLERATAALWSNGPELLPTAGCWVYGVADATGALADWLDALLARVGARLLLSQPPDPTGSAAVESRYSEEFLGRLAGRSGAGKIEVERGGAGAAQLRVVRAATPAAECEEVAIRVRALLDRGVEPEDIGISARRFDEYRSSLLGALERWAIPFSAIGLGSSGGEAERCVNGLARCLEEREALDLDTWVAIEPRLGDDERTCFHQLGLVDLGALCAPSSDAGFGDADWLGLPVRRSVDQARSVDRGTFARARGRAQAALDALARWPERAAASEYRALLNRLLDALGWRRAGRPHETAADTLDRLAAELPATMNLTADEWQGWFREAATRSSGVEPGGGGAGVQVLSVVAARERCFAHLFLMGLGRGVFPRSISEDPLFPEDLRWRLRSVLPDLPIKQRGHDEERHLFASLLAGAEEVTLSRSLCTASGREWPESPLLLRLRLARPELDRDAPRPEVAPLPDLAAVHAALRRDEATVDALLPELLAARQREGAALRGAPGIAPPPKRVAVALRGAWRELDVEPWVAAAVPLGPYFGWVGPPAADAPALYVTAFADLLRCPWQRFLRHELRLAPPPDAGASLPSPDARSIGGAVHRVLERVAEEGFRCERGELPRDLAARLAAVPVPLRWPDEATLDAWALVAARESARRDGIPAAWYPGLLAETLRPALERARALDTARSPAVYGAELEGVARVSAPAEFGPGEPREIRFRADRVEAGGSQGAVFVEYKSGACFLDRAQESTRVRVLGEVLQRGQGIQTPTYLYAEAAAASRLVFIGSGPADDRRETTLRRHHEAVTASFEQSIGASLRALDGGLRPPRLLGAKGEGEGFACAFCDVRIACLQGDSTQAARMRERLAAPHGPDAEALYLLEPTVAGPG